ncbi:MAG: Ppx/GppA family phosphatase [Gammaproteobacteria bacterium]|jgi:exopolyphosphatase / guanosine-5'-triphosphate,3'-diphosphate pyrophosphatase|nr:Ppx/GppA family phosphatase [Gammaproteobacteria bacterium]MBT4492482.1 Ppx/GppA family phosphatase [Gammaproteobacteria bacterium]MBT7372045.1 Ppx/GppA family phosphatase [Gammaproteobacteria bacterium]
MVCKNEYAAVDLGSNSFHMVIATHGDHGVNVIDRVREMVRLGANMDHSNRIVPEAEQRALNCLAGIGERLKDFSEDQVLVVGTNTLRRAHNAQSFINKAEQVLGFPIEVISGIEEARLIYSGVNYSLQEDRGRRMVIDIGGGSTEIIVGDGERLLDLESMVMGCVSFTQRYLTKGRIDKKRMKKAVLAARIELEPHVSKLRALNVIDVIGTSGTARAIEAVIIESGWSKAGISRNAIEKLYNALVDTEMVENLHLPGLSDERQPVFAGGVAIMVALFEALDIKRMRISGGALREGALIELIGRRHKLDTRAETVHELMSRYHIDDAQAERVKHTAKTLFTFVSDSWGLTQRNKLTLLWAAQLHEIGLSISHSQHHKHGAYILKHLELAGFSRQDQNVLAVLVRLHRRKFDLQNLSDIPRNQRQTLICLTILLRLSVVLNRGRTNDCCTPFTGFNVHNREVSILLPVTWLDRHPLTLADLENESRELERGGYKLSIMSDRELTQP